jgi:protoheme IX farnesyltransferase
MIGHLLQLTKPRISMLFAFTGLTALIMEGSARLQPAKLWLISLAIFMIGGAANALNQFFERDIDKLMARTAKKRPLAMGKIPPWSAVIFSIVFTAIGSWLLWICGNALAVFLGLATIGFYSFFYTLYLKPRTPYNIVIGGAAGAAGPLIAWAAAAGSISLTAWILFLIVFFWTPPHFWALALCVKEDYKAVKYPMLPLVKGDEETRRQILSYAIMLLPLSLSLYWLGCVGKIYFFSALVLGILFVLGAWIVFTKKTIKIYWSYFAYSILYLMLLFVALLVDALGH